MRNRTATVVTDAAGRTAASLRLARRGAAAPAEGHTGCLLLDPAAVIRLRALERVARSRANDVEATRRIADAQQAYAAQRAPLVAA